MTLPAASTETLAYMYSDDTPAPRGFFRQSEYATTLFTIDYTNWLLPGETITAVAVTASPIDTFSTSGAAAISVAGGTNNAVSLLAGMGTDGETYIVTVQITTSVGQIKVDTFQVQVAEADTGFASSTPAQTSSEELPVGTENFAATSVTLSSNSASPTMILAARVGAQGIGRVSATIENTGTDYVFIGNSDTAASGWARVAPGGSITLETMAEIDGYGNSGSQTVNVVETW